MGTNITIMNFCYLLSYPSLRAICITHAIMLMQKYLSHTGYSICTFFQKKDGEILNRLTYRIFKINSYTVFYVNDMIDLKHINILVKKLEKN